MLLCMSNRSRRVLEESAEVAGEVAFETEKGAEAPFSIVSIGKNCGSGRPESPTPSFSIAGPSFASAKR